MERVLVTAALPYANGHIHIGHLVEYLMTDVWARHQRMAGKRCVFVCADDTHGTAIMIRARAEGRSELEVIRDMREAHLADFAGFDVRFDYYGSTHSDANREVGAAIWRALRDKGRITEREVTQLFDPVAGTFLADRFVKGACPRCASPDQYGDSCDKCGSTYSPTELVSPVSTLSGAVPELRSATHLFVELARDQEFLAKWVRESGALQPEIANFLTQNFLQAPLRDWDVSRPAPYFGFEIPDAPGHYWYVWFDAPIGYVSSTREWCEKNGESFDTWWRDPATRNVHVIGKDIVYFHTLFWPAMLAAGGLNLPARVHVHGFLNVNGEKMSKSKGTFILARTWLEQGLDPTWLRYYYATKQGPKPDDLDLRLDELVGRVNGELVGRIANLASRTARLARARGLAATYPDDGGLFAAGVAAGESIRAAYDAFDSARATRVVLGLADRANEFLEKREPWKLAKDPDRADELQDVCSVALNLFRQIAIYLAPVLPRLAADAERLLGAPITSYADAATPLVGTPVAEFTHLVKRVELAQLEALVAASAQAEAPAPASPAPKTAASKSARVAPSAAPIEPLAPEIAFDDFAKIDLRVARVLGAEGLAEAKKLVRLTVDLGGGVTRTIMAGIKASYAPEQLVGRLVVVVANLAPRKMKLGTSEGMVILAGEGESLFLLAPDEGAAPGMRVR